MHKRRYFAWRLAIEADEADRRESKRRQLKLQRFSPTYNITDTQFILRYHLSKEAFEYLYVILKDIGGLQNSQRVSLQRKLLIVLLFYANGFHQKKIGIANSVSQEAVSAYIKEVTKALNHPNVVKKFVKFPSTQEERDYNKHSFFNKFGFPDTIGCLGSCHFPIVKPNKEEGHLFYCHKQFHSLNVQMVSDHNGKIMSINPKFGGATDDAFVWENSLLNGVMQNLCENGESAWLLGDSGYPQRPWLMTPYMNPIPGSAQETYNHIHSKTRVIIDNTFEKLKNQWCCLSKALHYAPKKCAEIIVACCVLHNLALEYQVPALHDVSVNASEFVDTHMISQQDDDFTLLALGRLVRDEVSQRIHATNQT